MWQHALVRGSYTALMSFIVLAFLACSDALDPSPTTVPSVAIVLMPTSTPEPLHPEDVLDNAVDALSEAGSLWFVLDHKNGFTEALGGLELRHIEGAITESGLNINAEANLGRIYLEVDAILIGKKTWLTNPLTGEWELLAQEENPIGYIQPIAAVRGILEGLNEATYIEPPEAGKDYQLRSPLRADVLKPLLGEIIPDGIGIGEVIVDRESFEMKSARIIGALQKRDTDTTVRIIELSRYGEDFIIEPPIE